MNVTLTLNFLPEANLSQLLQLNDSVGNVSFIDDGRGEAYNSKLKKLCTKTYVLLDKHEFNLSSEATFFDKIHKKYRRGDCVISYYTAAFIEDSLRKCGLTKIAAKQLLEGLTLDDVGIVFIDKEFKY